MNVWWGPGFPELFVFVLFVAFWVGVVWLIVALVRRDRPTPPGPSRPPALDVLEERYARGEITHEEFVQRRAVLTGGALPAPAPPAPSEPPAAGGQPG